MMTEDEARKIAKEAAKEALHDMLVALGVDPEDELENQKDFAFVRDWRLSSQAVKRQGLAAAVGVIVIGVLGLVWLAIKGG
jgi:hypothetical protein